VGSQPADNVNGLSTIEPIVGISLLLEVKYKLVAYANFRFQPMAGSLLLLQITELVSTGND
jgi:hypothetical protein